MNIVLTGGTGFIGLHLVRALHQNGHHVLCLVRPQANAQRLKALKAHATCLEVLPTSSSMQLSNVLAPYAPTLLVHLAAHYEGQHQEKTLTSMLQANLIFATQVLEACAQLGVKQFINTGTSWQHRLDHNYNPVNLYAASKQAFEALLMYYVEHYNLKAITLKLFDTYGPEDTRPKLFNQLRKAAIEGSTLKMPEGEQHLDLLYIDDVVSGYCSAINQLTQTNNNQNTSGSHETFFLSSGKTICLREVVNTYMEVTQRRIHMAWGALPYRPFEVMRPCKGIPSLPGWAATFNLREGIADMQSKEAT